MSKELEPKEEVLNEEVNEETSQEIPKAGPLDSLYNQETEQPEQEVSENSEEISQESSKEIPQEGGPKQSWKELRERAKRAEDAEKRALEAEKKSNEYYELLSKIEQEARQYSNTRAIPKQTDEEDFDYNSIDDDEILTGKDLKRSYKKEQHRLKSLEDNVKYQNRIAEEVRIESRLKAKHNDFLDVLNGDNINKLREMRPGLARSLHLNPDLEEKAYETYQAIKDLGIYRKDTHSQEKDIAIKNSIKPRPLNSVSPQMGNSPLSKANAFSSGTMTEDVKKQLYAEMLEKSRSR